MNTPNKGKLDEYPTQETDAMDNLRYRSDELFALCRDLERRLAFCREALESSQWLLTTECDDWREEARIQAEKNAEVLETTKP